MKRLLKALWTATWPLRRPFQRRFEACLTRSLSRALESRDPARAVTDEVTLVLDAVIAEQFRLQERVEEIHRILAEASFSSLRGVRSASFSRVVAHSESEIPRRELLSREKSDR
jgi:hypothetical protein